MPQTRNQTSSATQSKTGGVETGESTSTKTDNVEQSGTSSEPDPPRRDSPDNCSICLGPFCNKSFTSSCAHSFCFVCLKQWSKVKAECPLCKQPFTSIFHNIRSNQMYDIYELPRQPPNQVDQYNIYNYVGGGLTTFTAPTHHYLSLSQPFDADLTLSNFSRFQFRHRRYDRYLNPIGIHGEHQYSYTGPSVNPSSYVSAASWPRGSEDFRREVYRHNLGPPTIILGNENSTYRLTPAMVAASSHRLQRIMPWLLRELSVLVHSHQSVRLAVSMIQPLLTQISIDNAYFHDRVATLIGRRSRLFIQEFVAFANSALSMQAFDRKAMYRRREESEVLSSPSSTSSENDVVEITDVSPDHVVVSTISETLSSSSQPLDLRRSGWDSPTPGPSWSNLGSRDTSTQAVPIDRVSVSSESDDPVYIPEMRESDSENSKAGSDIIFVKYDKPWEERSPINLTSDAEKETAELERVKKKKKSKHKRKRKESNEHDPGKKEKSHKPLKGKSHSKHTTKSSLAPVGETGDDKGSSKTGSARKHHLSLSSPEIPRMKKHKKSKERREKSSDQTDRDRELVDRLFAEAFALQKGVASALEEKIGDSGKTGKSKHRSSRSSGKDKSKKKKKSKNVNRDSHSPSYSHSFKKHHSGHKKSSNASRISHTSPSGQNYTLKVSSTDNENGPRPTSRPSLRDPLNLEGESLNQPPHPSTSISHTVTPGFQPSYIPLPETVQHIPVNLWVSTWPALPVSHTYHAPRPPSSNLPGTSHSVPLNSSSSMPSATPAAHNAAGPSVPTLHSHTISSDSSSEYDSDDAHDRQIPSLKNVDSRTMHWLETHCPDLGRLQTNSSSVPEVAITSVPSMTSTTSSSSSSSSSSSDATVSNTAFQPQPSEKDGQTTNEKTDSSLNIEVVSVGSDEDIVICSSASDSDSDDVHCLEEQPALRTSCAVNNTSNSKVSESVASSFSKTVESAEKTLSTLPFLPEFTNTTTVSNMILPPANKTFQPFRLQKQSALTHQGKDPFFPSMSHSSDEDEENFRKTVSPKVQNSDFETIQTTSSEVQMNPSSLPANTVINSLKLDETAKTFMVDSNGEQDAIRQEIKTTTESRTCEGSEIWKDKTTELLSNSHTCEDSPASHSTSTFSTAGTVIFPVLTSMQQTNSPASSALPSSLNYLPYSPLPPQPPPTTSLASILPQPLPFTIPPATAQTSSLALHFPFHLLSPMMTQTQSHTLLPPIYQSQNQGLSSSTFASGSSSDQNILKNSEETSLITTTEKNESESMNLETATSDSEQTSSEFTIDRPPALSSTVDPCHSKIATNEDMEQTSCVDSTPIVSHGTDVNSGYELPIISTIDSSEKNECFERKDIENEKCTSLGNFLECPTNALNIFDGQDFLEETDSSHAESSASFLERNSNQMHPEFSFEWHNSYSSRSTIQQDSVTSINASNVVAQSEDVNPCSEPSSESSEIKAAEGSQDSVPNYKTNPDYSGQDDENMSVDSHQNRDIESKI